MGCTRRNNRYHAPLLCSVLLQRNEKQWERLVKLVSSCAKWEIFKHIYKLEIDQINEDIKETDKEFKTLLEAATHSLSESEGRIP